MSSTEDLKSIIDSTTDFFTGPQGSNHGLMTGILALLLTIVPLVGVQGKDVVAIMCLKGNSWGRYFIFTRVRVGARYEGMEHAFRNKDKQEEQSYELYRPPWETRKHDIVKVLKTIDKAQINSKPNLNIQFHHSLPVLKWAYVYHGKVATIFMMICWFAFAPSVLLLLGAKYGARTWVIVIFVVAEYICIGIANAVTLQMYNVHRSIVYLLLSEEEWNSGTEQVKGLTVLPSPDNESNPPQTSLDALKDVREGRIRIYVEPTYVH